MIMIIGNTLHLYRSIFTPITTSGQWCSGCWFL